MDVIVFDDGPVFLVFLVEDFRVQEMLKQLVEPLKASIGESTNLQ